jgi:primosomal protein N'
MAKLVMTIDSDNEIETKVKGRKQPVVIVSAEDEQILPSTDVIISTDAK